MQKTSTVFKHRRCYSWKQTQWKALLQHPHIRIQVITTVCPDIGAYKYTQPRTAILVAYVHTKVVRRIEKENIERTTT